MLSSNTSAANGAANYIEDVFSTWLYTGNGSTQTITNGIDLAGKGGLVWAKTRSVLASSQLYDTERGATKWLISNSTAAQATLSTGLTSFNSNGFSVGSSVGINGSDYLQASWTFRKQPKFFDCVTYTGNAASNQTINHNLGSAPGFMIVKATSTTGFWYCYHRSLGATKAMTLNTNDAESTLTNYWFNTAPTATQFTVGTVNNDSGVTYVAYLFAHDAGGFGLTGTDNVISCGSYTGGTIGLNVNLGYEPQWILTKNITSVNDWRIWDNMRGVTTGDIPDAWLIPNLSNAEATGNQYVAFNSTGFTLESANGSINGASNTYIYIAIRRGPMKVPTTGTSVFNATLNAAAASTKITTGFTPDTQIMMFPSSAGNTPKFYDRLRGVNTTGVDVVTQFLQGASTAAEASNTGYTRYWQNDGYQISSSFGSNQWIYWTLGRAPGFFDEVCYTGTGSTIALNHNLAAVPELMIVKSRGAATGNWVTYTATYGSGSFIRLNSTSGNNTGAGNLWGATNPTSSLFYVGEGGAGGLSVSANNYVAYLFATCPGVSKVGSYTGTGTTQQINCGFTAGARFVLIKRTDSTGDWYVWDSTRGIVSGNDPYLLLNSTAAEVTSTDYVDTYSAGFEISSTAPVAINASGGTFIFLAIA